MSDNNEFVKESADLKSNQFKTNKFLFFLLLILGTAGFSSAQRSIIASVKPDNSVILKVEANGAPVLDGSFILITLAASFGVNKYFAERKKGKLPTPKSK